MKQSTLKRSAPAPTAARKKVQTAFGTGTANEPIDLASQDGPIDLDAIEDDADDDSDVKHPVAGPSKSITTMPSSGPTTANPLNINPPAFDVQSCFTNVKPEVILKDPDLDLLYFKRMSECSSAVFCCM